MPITSGCSCALAQHLVEVVDDHVGEVAPRPSAARRSSGCRSAPADRESTTALARARRELHRLVVVAPVERVAVAGLGEQVGRDGAFGDPGSSASREMSCFDSLRMISLQAESKAPFLSFAQLALPLRIRVPVADQLVAALDAGLDHLGAVVVERGVDDRARPAASARRTAPGSARRRRGCRSRARNS